MSIRIPHKLLFGLEKRASTGALRSLKEFSSGVDLSSNDYLGIARALSEPERLARLVAECKGAGLGATGSRLVTGTSSTHLELERFLAEIHRAESALLFGSGYEANIGLLSCIASRTDTIVYDESIHASMRDGIRLSLGGSFSFKHNDLDDLRAKLRNARGDVYVAVESLYSMDGDCAPLTELCSLVEEVGAFLIVDEAHATGLYGPCGEGLVVEQGLSERVFARVHTFGKSVGYRGACVIGSAAMREHLINTSRPFIYSTAPDQVSLAFIREAYQLMREASSERARLFELIAEFRRLISEDSKTLEFLPVFGPIQGLVVPGNAQVCKVESALQAQGIFARAIRAPTVPAGRERIRLCLHSFNTTEELLRAVAVIRGELARQEAA